MSFKIRSLYTTAIVSGLMTFAAVAAAKYSAKDAVVTVTAHGPATMTVPVTTTNVEVHEKDSSIMFRVFFSEMKTGITLRDSHMREKVGTKQTDVLLLIPKSEIEKKKASGTVTGTVKFNKGKKDYPVKYTYDAASKKVHASLTIMLSDFGIKPAEELCNLGICVKDNVDVVADLILNE